MQKKQINDPLCQNYSINIDSTSLGFAFTLFGLSSLLTNYSVSYFKLTMKHQIPQRFFEMEHIYHSPRL